MLTNAGYEKNRKQFPKKHRKGEEGSSKDHKPRYRKPRHKEYRADDDCI